jgi:hypothetical protein
VKQTIFHPEARAEMREAVEFYEARLDGLGLRFLSAAEQTADRISAHPEAAPRLVANSASGSFPGFHTTSSIVYGKIISTSLPSLTNTVVLAIGASESTVANHRLKNDARRARVS